jgi:mono/diheme cytochrome c family protein
MRFLAFIGALGLIVAIAAVVFFFGGFYSVGGTAPEPDIVKWVLIQVRKASISRHATQGPPIAFDDAATMEGARAYAARGCVNCHGAPGVDWAKFSEGLRPDPPDLKDVVKERTPAQLFWVIKNGINMTGMPSFALAGVDDQEIWKIVAFATRLPAVSDADYKAWTTASASSPPSATAPVPSVQPPPGPPASETPMPIPPVVVPQPPEGNPPAGPTAPEPSPPKPN